MTRKKGSRPDIGTRYYSLETASGLRRYLAVVLDLKFEVYIINKREEVLMKNYHFRYFYVFLNNDYVG